MLVIRMQRTGRKGHAMFRVVVQDSRRTPTSGKVVAALGSYDPHAKSVSIDKEKAQFYLDHGAQPSDRIALLLKQEGVKLPKWVTLAGKKSSATRNPEKLRRNRPDEPVVEETPAAEAPESETSAESVAEAVETPAAEETSETPAEAVESVATEEAPAEAEPAAQEEKPAA